MKFLKSIFSFFGGGVGKWLALGLAIVGLLWAVDHYRASANLNAVKLERALERNRDLEAQKKLLEDTAAEWAAALERDRALASETAAANAIENARLSKLVADAATAKEGIQNAPGADDSFVFSDALYSWMRGESAAGNASDGGQAAD